MTGHSIAGRAMTGRIAAGDLDADKGRLRAETKRRRAAAAAASPGAAAMGYLASEDGFKHLVQQGSLTLPEELTEGKEWTTKVDVKNPIVGTQTIETTYVYKGSREGLKVLTIAKENVHKNGFVKI